MAYRKAILAEAQQEYRDIVGYLVGVLQSKQAARNFMEEFDKQAAAFIEKYQFITDDYNAKLPAVKEQLGID